MTAKFFQARPGTSTIYTMFCNSSFSWHSQVYVGPPASPPLVWGLCVEMLLGSAVNRPSWPRLTEAVLWSSGHGPCSGTNSHSPCSPSSQQTHHAWDCQEPWEATAPQALCSGLRIGLSSGLQVQRTATGLKWGFLAEGGQRASLSSRFP